MSLPTSAGVNDPRTVAHDYEDESRFLNRRLTTWAELEGPSVEEQAFAVLATTGPASVLEVGCGTGDHTEQLTKRLRVPVTGIDLSFRMTQRTNVRGIPAVNADIAALPFADATFGAVFANRVLYHVPDLGRGAAEISRVLARGGTMVSIDYHREHLAEVFGLLGLRSTAPPTTSAIEDAFASVERRVVEGRATFASRDAVVGYLRSWGAYAWFADRDLEQLVPPLPNGFVATYRHELRVAR